MSQLISRPPPPPPSPSAIKNASDYAGTFTSPDGSKLVLLNEGEQLFHSDNAWYGSTRFVIRKGQLLVAGDQPLAPVEPGVFRPADDPSDADRVTFDNIVDGQAMRMNYSGIEFFRSFTP